MPHASLVLLCKNTTVQNACAFAVKQPLLMPSRSANLLQHPQLLFENSTT
jgi:hypothetical protein